MDLGTLQMLIAIVGIVQILVVALLVMVLKVQMANSTSLARIDERLTHIPTFSEMQEADRESRHAACLEVAGNVADVQGQVNKLAGRVDALSRPEMGG